MDIYPYHKFVYSQVHKIGNVNTNIDREKFIEQLLNNECIVKMFCRLSFPYENYSNTQTLNRPSIRQFYFNKVFFTQTIHLYLDLSEE